MNKKILYIILGAAAIVLGICSAFDRELAVILAGIGLLIYGFGGFFRWRERSKAGAAGVWALGGMIVAIGFGIFILIGGRIGESAERFLLISLSIWLMAEGVLEFLGGVMYLTPSEDLGGILAFDRKKIDENLEMGYRDTLRKFAVGRS